MKEKELEVYTVNDIEFLNVHSAAIHIENKLTLKQRLAWFYMLMNAKNDLDNQQVHRISLSQLKKSIGYTSTNNKILKEDLKKLRKTEVEWNILNKDKTQVWGIGSLLSDVEILNGYCEYSYSPKLIQRFFSPSMYAKLNLIVSRSFKSKNTLAIYTLAIDYLQIKKNYGEKYLTCEETKKYLGLDLWQYKRGTDLYKHVLRKSEIEINKLSDIDIKIVPTREMNKIIGFRLQMSIKNDFIDLYKSKKLITNFDIEINKQIENKLSQLPIDLDIKPVKVELEKIKVENDVLKRFITENNISMSTKTVQEKLRVIKNSFSDKFEDYLIFLMNYTKEEMKKTSIKNVSGFFVSLIKDEDQLQNYIMYFQEKEIEKQKRQSKLKDLLELELNGLYNSFLDRDFIDFLVNNADRLEKEIVHILKSNLKEGDFFYDVVLPKHNNIIDKTLLTDENKGTRYFVTHYLSNYKKELNYVPWTFEEWKQKKVNKIDLKSLEAKLERSLDR